MPIINRLLIAAVVWEVLVLATLPTRSQPATDAIPVPMTSQEQAAVLAMCDNATWAAKRQFDGVCEFFRIKFETAVRDAKVKANADKAALPASAEQPKE